MKKRLLILTTILFIFVVFSCKKKKNKPPRDPSPKWEIDSFRTYPVSMTAVVKPPSDLLREDRKGEKLGAFVKKECRGIGKLVQLEDTTAVYFVLIHGKASEKAKIRFKYYNGYYIYQTPAFLDFATDGNFGTADIPVVLDVERVADKN